MISEDAYNAYKIPQDRGGWKLLNYLLDAGVTGTLLEGCKYYAKYHMNDEVIPFVSMGDAVQAIKKTHGVAILAHPGEQIDYNPYASDNDLFSRRYMH